MDVGTFLRRMLTYLRPYWVRSVVILLCLLLETGFTCGVPLGFKFLIDNAITPKDWQIFAHILSLLAGGAIVVSLTGLSRDYLYARLCAALSNHLRARMFSHLQQLSSGFYSRTEIGDIIARFSIDLAAIENAAKSAIPWAILPALEVLLSSLLLFALDWHLALVAMMVFPLSLIGPRYFTTRALTASSICKQDEARVITAVQEAIETHAVVKVFGLEQHTERCFQERLDTVGKSSMRTTFLSAMVERSASCSIFALQVLVLGEGAYLVFNNILSLGALVSFESLFLTLSWSLSYVTQYIPQLVQATSGLQRIEELLSEVPQISNAPGAVTLPPLRKAITFDSVQFRYPDRQHTLGKLDFTIPAGEMVALVGPSGAGKSTLLHLLTRLYDPIRGCIAFDGFNLRYVTQESLRAQIGVVFQESILFNTTIRENIRMGKPGASDAEVEAMAQVAEIHSFIVSLPSGYDTVVGKQGGLLSGGQKQRIAIARALLRSPTLLLLDEATSALDPEVEATLISNLKNATKGRTILMVTHRLASAMGADRIFVLDQGRIVEHGRHSELLARGDRYARLWRKAASRVVGKVA